MKLAVLLLISMAALAADAPRLFPIRGAEGKKIGLIDNKGKVVVEPRFDKVEPYSEGLASFWQNGHAGYVNYQGKVVVEPAYDFANDFHEGIGITHQGDKYFLFDTSGRKIAEINYRVLGSFHAGLCRIQERVFDSERKQNRTYYGYIDRKGNVAIKPQFINAGEFPDDGVGLTYAYKPNERGGFFIDHTGKTVIQTPDIGAGDPTWSSFKEGLLRFKKDGWWGFRDNKGNWAIEPKYDAAEDFQYGRARVQFDGKWMLIDNLGRHLPEQNRYALQKPYSEGFAVARANGRLTYVNENGEAPFRLPLLEQAFSFSNGLARVRIDNRYGFIDRTGAFAIKPTLSEAGDFQGGLASVWLEDRTVAYIDTTGKPVYQWKIR